MLYLRVMSKVILITGGARSGKSVIAEKHATALGQQLTYIATAQIFDDEMANRVKLHQARRQSEWTTISEPFNLFNTLQNSDGNGPRLVDCLTLWLTNMILDNRDWQQEAHSIIHSFDKLIDPIIFVTNEVGSGIVPENKLAREFRDAAGALNQMIAQASDEVYMAISGLPLKVK